VTTVAIPATVSFNPIEIGIHQSIGVREAKCGR